MKPMPTPAMQVAGIFIPGFVRGDSGRQGALFPVSLDELVPQAGDFLLRRLCHQPPTG
jgi:hypothetical protein